VCFADASGFSLDPSRDIKIEEVVAESDEVVMLTDACSSGTEFVLMNALVFRIPARFVEVPLAVDAAVAVTVLLPGFFCPKETSLDLKTFLLPPALLVIS
jgi:predicted LPLAT superfamily acyltransferase